MTSTNYGRVRDMYEEGGIGLTSDSAFLVIWTGGSGLAPGEKGMPRAARTCFLEGGRRLHVMKRTALMDVLAVV